MPKRKENQDKKRITGTTLGSQEETDPQRFFQEPFAYIFLRKAREFRVKKEFTGTHWRVLSVVIDQMQMHSGKVRLNQSEIARELEIHRTGVNRVIQDFLEWNILYMVPGHPRQYWLMPDIAYKGRANGRIRVARTIWGIHGKDLRPGGKR